MNQASQRHLMLSNSCFLDHTGTTEELNIKYLEIKVVL